MPLLLGSVAIKCGFGLALRRLLKSPLPRRTLLLRLSLGTVIAANLGLLFYFNYANFFLRSLNGAVGTSFGALDIILSCSTATAPLYRLDTDARTKDDPAERDFPTSEATRRGFQALDMGPIFAADYREHRAYFDFYPLDRHLSAYGNALVAQHIAALLETRSTPEPQR